MANKDIKYLCEKCKAVKSPAIETILPNDHRSQSTIPQDIEYIRVFVNKETNEKTRARKLECGHYVKISVMGFNDHNSENLNEHETANLRKLVDKEMLGKNGKEVEEAILFHCEQYQLLLKVAKKQEQQAKYVIQYLDQIKEKYKTSLSEEDKQSLDMKFATFLGQRPTSNKTLERARTEVEKATDRQKKALEEMMAVLGKKGYDPKSLFKKSVSTSPSPEQSTQSTEQQ